MSLYDVKRWLCNYLHDSFLCTILTLHHKFFLLDKGVSHIVKAIPGMRTTISYVWKKKPEEWETFRSMTIRALDHAWCFWSISPKLGYNHIFPSIETLDSLNALYTLLLVFMEKLQVGPQINLLNFQHVCH